MYEIVTSVCASPPSTVFTSISGTAESTADGVSGWGPSASAGRLVHPPIETRAGVFLFAGGMAMVGSSCGEYIEVPNGGMKGGEKEERRGVVCVLRA